MFCLSEAKLTICEQYMILYQDQEFLASKNKKIYYLALFAIPWSRISIITGFWLFFLKGRGSSDYPNSTAGKLQCKLINLCFLFSLFRRPTEQICSYPKIQGSWGIQIRFMVVLKVRARVKETTAKVMLPSTRLYGFPDAFHSVHRGLKPYSF